MKPRNLFFLELADAVADRRAFAMRLGVPLLLALPFVFVSMPARAKAAGLVMLVMFTCLFGAAVAYVRRRTDGRLARLRLLPIPRRLVFVDLLLAGVAVDLMQLVPVFALFLAVNAASLTAGSCMAVTALLCATVLLLNAVGMLLATAMRSSAEVHLTAALAVGVLAVLCGVVPVPDRLAPVVGAVGLWAPPGQLGATLAGVVEVSAPGALAFPSVVLALVLAAALLLRCADRPGPLTRREPENRVSA